MKSMFDPDRRSSVAAGCRVADPLPGDRRYHHPDFDKKGLQGWRVTHREGESPGTPWQAERERGLRVGRSGADSPTAKGMPPSSRGELPHYAGINPFLKAPYVENVRDVGKYQ